MITKPTVLILGAGSSNHLGYPLGGELINSICNLNNIREFKTLNNGFFPDDLINSFIHNLSRAQYYSIDSFLENNNAYLDIGKAFISFILKKHEIIDNLFPPKSPGWYQYLFNSICDDSIDKIGKNKLTIITFNYDRSLECYLHESLKSRYHLTDDDSSKCLRKIRIIHIHGILGKYPQNKYSNELTLKELQSISKGIKIIHELRTDTNDFCSAEYLKCYKYLSNAVNIYFLGFGFHLDNITRFRFFDDKNIMNKTICATSAGLMPIEMKRQNEKLKPFGLDKISYDGNVCNAFFRTAASLE